MMKNKIFQAFIYIHDWGGDEDTILKRIYSSDSLDRVQKAVDLDVRNHSSGDWIYSIDTTIAEALFVEVEPGLSKLVFGTVARSSLQGGKYSWQILDEAQLTSESRRQIT
jgi:hypothetical protein